MKISASTIRIQRDLRIYFLITSLVFVVKFIIIMNLNPERALDIGNGKGVFLKGILNGSDGENYLNALFALINQGLFSSEQILSYFPAGYPLLMYLFYSINQNSALIILSTFQSFMFSYSVYTLCKYLLKTKIKKYVLFICMMIIFNPTLTSSSLIIGYESLTASGTLLIISLLIKYRFFDAYSTTKKLQTLLYLSIICGFITFLQPRLILGLFAIIFVAIISKYKVKKAIALILITSAISLILPASLVYRNIQASDIKAISTNLGTTMNLGAGENTTGSYWDADRGIKCESYQEFQVSDSELIRCVFKWYLENPKKSVELFIYKSVYFWSPWIGPLAEGTTGRNPWLRYGPYSVIKELPVYKLIVDQRAEILVSQIWQISTLLFLGIGLLVLIRMKLTERFIGIILIIPILINWAISLLTIGDHRFRIPISGASVLLQSIGIFFVLKNLIDFFKYKTDNKT
jgi:hypothetical protein